MTTINSHLAQQHDTWSTNDLGKPPYPALTYDPTHLMEGLEAIHKNLHKDGETDHDHEDLA